MRGLFLSTLFFVLAAGARSQQATAGTFGFGCGPSNEPYATTLSYVGLPQLGATFTVAYRAPTWSGGRSSVWAHLVTGSSNQSLFGLSLPLRGGDWLAVSAWHCMIWTSSEWYTAFTVGYPQGQVQLAVPLDARLVGLRLYQQWVLSQLLCWGNLCDGALWLSNGGVITLGY